ncbi:galactokinase [Salipaludibacillus keqinensis]|jgi:galactokinase|uniref:Galactokinase n=1 Tax=Salipaludibacillus keqinensis TaxID=2045207 RepID=A0A323TRQ9_9BACI|nr:galactokinase [Salipaludibacillus keqinensis]PYZ92055.1 galactokinase [Salipaludibacillus keqinensis]
MLNKLEKSFQKVFETNEIPRTFLSPGRVNLIGEHTDYNGGYVFPCALSVGTYVTIVPRQDRKLRFYSENFPELGVIEASLDQLEFKEEHDWANYPKGVIHMFQEQGLEGAKGFDAYFFGNIPNGAGLSSSASIELAMAIAWDALNDFHMERIPMVQLCQRAENEYIGVNCGIMDQFAIGMGKKNHAILLDCNTLEYSYAPVELEGVKLVLANTNKRRGLADSKYNERRSECEAALTDLQKTVSIHNLCDMTPAQFEQYQSMISNDTAKRRAKHAVDENARTLNAQQKLQQGDLVAFGELMNESHRSLRDDYEVTGEHLDALVESAWAEPTVLGARMTGAGFGGCTVNLINEDGLDDTLSRMAETYKQRTGIEPEFYVVDIGEGTREITNEHKEGV